jgi:hypothetical protein
VDDAKMNALLAQCRPNPCAEMQESLKNGWKVIEYLPAHGVMTGTGRKRFGGFPQISRAG